MSIGQKIIVTVGAFVITFISACFFFKSDINFLLTSKSVERQYGQTAENSYFLEDNFDFVDNYESAEIHSKEEIIASIYYLINSGVTNSKRYCAKDYETCYEDMEMVSNDTNLLSVLNNKSNMSTKDKIKAIHDYIINNTEYDTKKSDNIKDTTYKSNTAYGVLIQGYGICSGYSDARSYWNQIIKLNKGLLP